MQRDISDDEEDIEHIYGKMETRIMPLNENQKRSQGDLKQRPL